MQWRLVNRGRSGAAPPDEKRILMIIIFSKRIIKKLMVPVNVIGILKIELYIK